MVLQGKLIKWINKLPVLAGYAEGWWCSGGDALYSAILFANPFTWVLVSLTHPEGVWLSSGYTLKVERGEYEMSPAGDELSYLSQLFSAQFGKGCWKSVEGSQGTTIHSYSGGQDLALKS